MYTVYRILIFLSSEKFNLPSPSFLTYGGMKKLKRHGQACLPAAGKSPNL
jgi:hypothetical protein